MKSINIGKVVSQDLQHISRFISYEVIPSTDLATQHIKCISPVSSSQKLYKYKELELAEEFEQAIDANSLEQINNLLNKLVEPDEGR